MSFLPKAGIALTAPPAVVLVVTPAASAAPACSLVTKAEVSAALGVMVGAPNGPLPKLCQWRQQAKPGADILIADLNGPDRKLFDNAKSMAGFTGATIKPVGGLGDGAFHLCKKVGRMTSDILWFRKGDAAFSVRVWGGKIPDADAEAKAKAIAVRVLTRV